MKWMRTEEAVGQVLCHDVTQIIRGKSKGPVFRKGHVIRQEDIPTLLSAGKDHVYIWEAGESMLHENEAACMLYELCRNEHLSRSSEIREGKVELIADCDGLLEIDREALDRVNSCGPMMIASVRNYYPAKKGQHVAGMRIIPLVIEREKMERARRAAGGRPIFKLTPYRRRRVGIVTTGNEVYYGRIRDEFTPVVEAKIRAFGSEIVARELSTDDPDMAVKCMERALDAGADLLLCTGGMSVDPDDRTPAAIRRMADEVVSYGAPVLPGAMFMLAYRGKNHEIPIMGLPGCVMYERRTIFDLVLPRVLAGQVIKKEELDRLGAGGYCMHCVSCIFPNCAFGAV